MLFRTLKYPRKLAVLPMICPIPAVVELCGFTSENYFSTVPTTQEREMRWPLNTYELLVNQAYWQQNTIPSQERLRDTIIAYSHGVAPFKNTRKHFWRRTVASRLPSNIARGEHCNRPAVNRNVLHMHRFAARSEKQNGRSNDGRWEPSLPQTSGGSFSAVSKPNFASKSSRPSCAMHESALMIFTTSIIYVNIEISNPFTLESMYYH